MAVVSDLFRTRWSSRNHVGAARPQVRAFIRRGRFNRRYAPWDGEDFGFIPEENRSHHWQAMWEANLSHSIVFPAWTEIPNIREATIEQGFDENGLNRLTLAVDNVLMRASTGPGGSYHAIERGFLSPIKGFTPPSRPAEYTANEWYTVLNRNVQLSVWEGYGADTMTQTFMGLIDDIDVTAKPDMLTILARDFGQQLVDSRVFGWNISKQLKDPVTFAARDSVIKHKGVGTAGPGDESSHRSGHPARYVADARNNTAWISHDHTAPGNTEWVQIRLPAGRYDSVKITPLYSHMEMYVGLYARAVAHSNGGVSLPTRDGVELSGGFVNVSEGALGEVPGSNGGWDYIRKIDATTADHPSKYSLGAEYNLGDDSVLRVGFRKLKHIGYTQYRAGVTSLRGIKIEVDKSQANSTKWVLTDDASDAVRVILRWAGFKEWAVEDTGTPMKDKLVVNRGDYYIDVIRKLAETTGFVFFMDDADEPRTLAEFLADTGPGSLGIPTFRQSTALKENNGIEFQTAAVKTTRTIRDREVLTAIEAKFTDEPLGYIIRVRGAVPKDGGFQLGGDSTRRVMFVYRPPWWSRLAGLVKHVIHTDPMLKTNLDCEVGCYLVALNEALQSATGTISIPGNPEFMVDDQVYVVDAATGLATRLWVASRSSTFTAGQNGSWKTTLAGSLIDTPDIVDIKAEIETARTRGVPVPPVVIGSYAQPD